MSDEFINFLQSAGISLSNGKIECKTSIPVERINIDIGLSPVIGDKYTEQFQNECYNLLKIYNIEY